MPLLQTRSEQVYALWLSREKQVNIREPGRLLHAQENVPGLPRLLWGNPNTRCTSTAITRQMFRYCAVNMAKARFFEPACVVVLALLGCLGLADCSGPWQHELHRECAVRVEQIRTLYRLIDLTRSKGL